MGFDEKLFGAAQRMFRRWRKSSAEDTDTVALETETAALRHLACLLTGRAMEVRTAEADGEIWSDVLLLPEQMSFANSTADNASAYVFRVAYAATSQELGFQALQFASDPANTIASLLAVPRTVDELDARWPGAGDLRRRLGRVLLAELPTPANARPDLAALLGLHAAMLGQTRDELSAHSIDADARTWIERATAMRPTPAELDTTTHELLAALPRPRRARPIRIELPLFGRLTSRERQRGARGTSSISPDQTPDHEGSVEPTTERRGKNRERVETLDLGQNDESTNPLIHVFEKLFTAEEYQGGRKSLDGSDELEEHAEALDELALRKVVRTEQKTSSLYRADILLDDAGVESESETESGEPTAVYDEWNEGKRSYRPSWCRVYESVAPSRLDPIKVISSVRTVRQRFAAQIRELRAAFERLERQRALRSRQQDGTDIDLDAIVDRFAALRASEQHGGEVSDDRLYTARRRHARDSATMILVDTSMSTDAWIDGRRVLDVVRESALVLGEVLDSCPGVHTGIGAFHSKTRHSCHYEVVKQFDESWSRCHGRLLSLRPTGYTRIGPAIRHATALLAAVPARQKLLLLLSDGKPTDYDRYEGRYGVADVRQALREASRQEVRSFALTVEAEGKFYLPQMFGPRGFRVLKQPSELPRSLAMLHQDLV